MEEVTVLQVLQVAHPQSQGALQKAIQLDQAFNWMEPARIEKYSQILRNISEMQDHGEANITIQIRDGEIVNQEYGKRYK